jgi:hypothetical protein
MDPVAVVCATFSTVPVGIREKRAHSLRREKYEHEPINIVFNWDLIKKVSERWFSCTPRQAAQRRLSPAVPFARGAAEPTVRRADR